jgi:para-nitrobenzyl esterase
MTPIATRYRLARSTLLVLVGCSGADKTDQPEPSRADTAQNEAALDDTADVPPLTEDSGQAAADTGMPPDEPSGTPPAPVHLSAVYWVNTTGQVVYAQGLTHSTWGSDDGVAMDLTLDIYEPIGAPAEHKPALIVVHGGGFKIGSPIELPLVDWAHYFAARGFVVFSVGYRVAKFYGTIPADWPTDPSSVHDSMDIDQINALYTAGRDLKAAVRWIRANASEYGIHTEAVAAMGGSAGASIVVMLAVSSEDDYSTELTAAEDPTLSGVHMEQPSKVGAAIDLWGDTSLVDALMVRDGIDRFDASDTPLAIIHGVNDETIPFSEAEEIKAKYETTGATYRFHSLNADHSAWDETIDGQSLSRVGFGFIAAELSLTVEP